MKLFFVIPVYNEVQTVAALARGILEHVPAHDTRILFVDDGSIDGTYEALEALGSELPQVETIRFRRNVGKSQALAAGFARAEGDAVITMDGDLQDDPSELPRMLEQLDNGYDVVCGWKRRRNDPWHKTIPSYIYNQISARIFGLDLHDINTGFKAMRIEVVRGLRLYGDRHRLIAVYAHQLGYRVGEIPVAHHARRYGQSNYGIERFSRGALDVLTAWFLDRHRYAPAHFFGKHGSLGIMAGGGIALAGAGTLLYGQTGAGLFLWFSGLLCLLAGGLLVSLGLATELLVYRMLRPDFPRGIEEKHSGREEPR